MVIAWEGPVDRYSLAKENPALFRAGAMFLVLRLVLLLVLTVNV